MNGAPFMKLVRECTCTFLCCNRPKLEVYDILGGRKEFMGRVEVPFKCCDRNLTVYGPMNNHLYTISGNCC